MKNGELKHISGGMRAAGTIVFLLLIYAPLTIYCSNCNDFSFDIFDLLKYFVPLSIVCFFIAAFVLMMFNRISMKLYYAVETILYALLLGFFIQGNFFSGYLPTLTGEEPLWSTFSSYRYFSIVIWIASAATALAVCRIPHSKRAPVSYSESVNTFLSLLNGKNSIAAVSAHAGERMYYEWNIEDNTSWLVELSQSGKATDSNTLAETGNVFKNNNYGQEIEKYSIG